MPLEVTFASGYNGDGSCHWDFGNGTDTTACGPITVVYDVPGTYLAQFTVQTANGCSATALVQQPVQVVHRPQAAFTERMFYGPTNARAQVAPAAMARTALAPEYRSRVIPLDWNEMLRLRETWNQRWRRDVIAAASR